MQQMLLNDRGEPVPDPATTPAVIPGTLIGHWLQMHEKLVQGDLLDLGAGNQPYASWYQTRIDRAVAVDFNAAVGLQARCAGEALPFANHSFDVVLATEVLEHIPRPELAVAEMVRVLRPGGSVLITTPFIYPVHEAPYDFWRFTHFGLQALCQAHGLDVIDVSAKGGITALATHVVANGLPRAAKVLAQRSPFFALGPRVAGRLIGLPQRAVLARSRSLEVSGSARLVSLGYMIAASKPLDR